MSAHAIAATLPGGDPLAAALAAGETPSPELSEETEDMEAVLALALKDPRVDPTRVFVAGKSLGTLVGRAAQVANGAVAE